MHEIVVNLHMHTPYSDGFGTHQEIADAALEVGIDAVIVTDHNVWVDGIEGYFENGGKRVLLLVGEEIHDQVRVPQKNHMLVFGADRELAPLARKPQRLIDGVKEAGGLAFLAHPYDPESKAFGEPNLGWETWDITGYTGIELWNAMSEFKGHLKTKLHGLYYALNPDMIPQSPPEWTLEKWDQLTATGKKVVAVGGSDAHALRRSLGPVKRILFPYGYHFRCVNTHVLIPEPLKGDHTSDKATILSALEQGHAFIGNDLPGPTHGFRFSAQGKEETALMGDEISSRHGITLQARLPIRTECRLLKNGTPVKTWIDREHCTHITSDPGVYRIEAFTSFKGTRRGWIYSNPIYVREELS